MKKWLLPAAAAALTLAASGAALAQPYGHYGGPAYGGHGYGHRYYGRDSDHDGVPNRAEWGRDRDRDGRPDQWDRHDDRRDWRWRHRHAERRHHWPYYRDWR
jgi:hypothetical protein